MDQTKKNIKIGFDGKRAVNNNTGLGNYSRLIIEALAENFPEMSLNIYAPKIKDSNRLSKIKNFSNVRFFSPQKNILPGSRAYWRTFRISNQLKRDGINLYHGLSNELPLNIDKFEIPSVVTIHDVIYRQLPECYSTFDQRIYDWKYGRSCKVADRIIAVSECTKKDIIKFYGIDESKIDVVYQGCDPQFRKEISNGEIVRIRKEYGLPEKYIIQVGTIELRKNLELTVRAMASLPEEICLVAIGRDRNAYKSYVEKIAEEIGVAKRIYFLENVPFNYFPALYHGALAAAYPSKYEGFGIPILESISCGLPTIAATGSCLEEAGGEGAIYVDPTNPRQLSEALNAVFSQKELAESLIHKGLTHVSKFKISDIAQNVMSVYQKLFTSH